MGKVENMTEDQKAKLKKEEEQEEKVIKDYLIHLLEAFKWNDEE